MNEIKNCIEQQIADLLIRSPEFKELSKQMDVYCPFEALSIERTEIRHSNFLADIINPNRPHGFGDSCLKAFLGGLLETKKETLLHLEIYLDDSSDIQIFREWNNIDLLIVIENNIKKIVFAIEIKIYANESEGQLQKYDSILIDHFNDCIVFKFFLTTDGRVATNIEWTPVTFDAFIDGWEDILQNEIGANKSRVMLESYIKMLKRKFMSNPDLEKIAKVIWSKHKSALEYLIDQQPNPLFDILKQLKENTFISRINTELQKSNLNIKIGYDSHSSKYLRYAVLNWDKIPEMISSQNWTSSNRILLYEIQAYGKSVTTRFVLGKGDSSTREKIYNILHDNIDLNRKRKEIKNDYTSMSTKTIVSQDNIKSIISSQDYGKNIDQIKDIVIKDIIETVPKYHNAVMKLIDETITDN